MMSDSAVDTLRRLGRAGRLKDVRTVEISGYVWAIVLDPSLPPDEIRLEDEHGQSVTIRSVDFSTSG